MPRHHSPMGDIHRIVAANLRAARLARRMTLDVLARDLEISESLLSKIENGHTRIQLDRLDAAARMLGVELASLFRRAQKDMDQCALMHPGFGAAERRSVP